MPFHESRVTVHGFSRPELAEQLRIRHHVANEVTTFKDAERPAIRIGFGEAIQLVATAGGTVNHYRLGMPTVGFHRDGC